MERRKGRVCEIKRERQREKRGAGPDLKRHGRFVSPEQV